MATDVLIVRLGNSAPLGAEGDGGNAVTYFQVPKSDSLDVALTTVRSVFGQYHSSDPPEWVECDEDALLAELIARAYTWDADDSRDKHTCKVGRPKSWKGIVDPALEPEGDA